jgi:transposase
MGTKYLVKLTTEEREQLERMVRTGKRAAATLTHARILLKADAGCGTGPWENERIAEAVETSVATVHRVRQAFVEEGLEAALYRQKPTGRQYRKLDGEGEARLVALACSTPPVGRTRWTMQLLADKLVELKIVDTISDDTVHRTLKKTTLSRG